MLYCLLDGHARTSTKLGIIAEVGPSTASVHLARLKEFQLVGRREMAALPAMPRARR